MKRKHTNSGVRRYGRWLLLLLGVGVSACVTAREHNARSIDNFVQGIQNPAMRELWSKADAEGKLPPIEAIPVPAKRVAQRKPGKISEPPLQPRRPVIPPSTIVDAQLFSSKPIMRYDGKFHITRHELGVLVGAVDGREEPLELYYKLPGDKVKIAVPEREVLMLTLRDEVVDSALQRRIVLSTDRGTTPFIYIAEGSTVPYRLTIEALKLTIEQQKGDGHPPVTITYGDKTVTIKEGERARISEGKGALDVYLRESIAIRPQQVMLQEGQPFYVDLFMYRSQ